MAYEYILRTAYGTYMAACDPDAARNRPLRHSTASTRLELDQQSRPEQVAVHFCRGATSPGTTKHRGGRVSSPSLYEPSCRLNRHIHNISV